MAVLAALNLAYRLAEVPQAQAPAPAPLRKPAAPEVGSTGQEALIDDLISRLDSTLGDDGQLL
jgi:hypothetical protein